MGGLVKEILRRICVETGWTYAVFWKGIPCGDQMRLVWEDGHCEQASSCKAASSGFEAIDMLIKESGVLRGGASRVGNQVEDRVRALVFKLMASQVHVMGAGIVGKAALTGKHEWVIGEMLSHNECMSKGMVEISNQVSAGVKTVAVIPVFPHGLVQLGSTRMVLENFGLINRVKGLFEQLRYVPGLLLSENTRKCLGRNLQQHESVGMQTSDQFLNSGASLNSFSSPKQENMNCQYFGHPDSGKMPDNVPVFPLALGKMPSVEMLANSLSQPMRQPGSNSILHQNNQPENALHRASAMFCSDDRLIENVMPCDPNSCRQHQPPVGLSYNRWTESQLLSMSGTMPKDLANSELTSHKTNMLGLQSKGCTSLYPQQGSDTISSYGRNQLIESVDDVGKLDYFPNDSGSLRSQYVDSSFLKVPQVVNLALPSKCSQNIPGDVEQNHIASIDKKSFSESYTDKHKTDNGLFQALEAEAIQFDRGGAFHNSFNKRGSANDNDIKGNETLEFQQALDENFSNCLQASSGNDLFDMFQLDHYKSGFSHGSLENVIKRGTDVNAHELSTDVSTCITELDLGPIYNEFDDETGCSGMFLEAGSDQLLDAVVSQFNPSAKHEMYDNAACKNSLANISSYSLHTNSPNKNHVASRRQTHEKTFGLPPDLIKSEPAASSSAKSSCSMERTEGCLSQRSGDYKSQISLWVDNGQKMNCDNYSIARGKKAVEAGKPNRKRSRPGENPRPRPKDRQLIQDRVKELREIIPSGAKCSIDVLLEKTIKHMLFLQSVTKHAENLKETGEPKIISNEEGLLLKDNFEGGATWAFEVGSQSMICPIVVEDLNPPRQMLVEMLCEERGMFLEIADLVRGLGLTILKGVMESRNGKVWARFAVEANGDVTRMEIFMSLVQLLEPSTVRSKAPENVDNLDNPQHVYPSPSSVPDTRLPGRLW